MHEQHMEKTSNKRKAIVADDMSAMEHEAGSRDHSSVALLLSQAAWDSAFFWLITTSSLWIFTTSENQGWTAIGTQQAT